jgi:heptosyltransferase-2
MPWLRKPVSRRDGVSDPPERICVRAPNWLGDLVIATGFLRAVLERWPGASVDLIVPSGFEGLPLPRRGRVITYDAARTAPGVFGGGLRRERYDRFYVLPPSFSAAWMAWRSGAPERIGYRGELRGPLLRPALGHRARARSVHLLREYLDLLDPDLPLDCYPPRLELPSGWADERLGRTCRELPRRFIAMAPGAAYGPAKAWPAACYAAAAAALRDRAGLPVVLLGAEREAGLGEQVRAGAEGVLNWCGATDLPGLVAALSRAELLVSNDSGAMHVMAALRRPQVALFGSTAPVWTGPLNPQAAVVTRSEPCAPCFARTCRYGHTNCLALIEPETVVTAALGLLAGRAASPAHPS